jgi:predicted amidohydrolase
LIIVPSNSPGREVTGTGLGSQESWYSLLKNYALLGGNYLLFANRVGTEDGITFYGGSAVVDPFGKIEKQAGLFKEELLVVDIDLEKVKKARFQMPLIRDENLDLTIRELNRIKRKRTGEGTW